MTEYKNPQNDPGSQQRMLLLLVFFFVAIFALQYFLPKPSQPQPEQQKASTPTPAGQSQGQPTPAAPNAATPGPRARPAQGAPKVPVKQGETESETVLENEYYRVVFTNRGALAKSWVLKTFKDNNGKPLELVSAKISNEIGYPLSLFSYDKALEKKLNEALYVSSSMPSSITFEYSDGDTTIRKIFRAEPMYVVGMEIEVTKNGQRVQAFPQWPGGLGDLGTAASYSGGKIDFQQNGTIEHKAAASGWFLTGGKKWVVGGQTFPGPFEWAGTADQYFAATFMPESPQDAVLVTLHNQVEIPRDPKKPNETKEKVSVLGVAVGNASGLTRQRLFAGPKTQEALKSTLAQPDGPNLSGMTDFGIFGFIAKPLFFWLRWTYQHWIPDWGWAIAFLTVVITLALFPLRLQGMKSALRMQKIQPQMKALQEKYKRYSLTDPRRAEMQKEMSELYKREGVNPVGGCFPMLLQMPFLFAFYSMLQNAIELRQASWLWIHDLSAPDPWHVLPIIIIVTMFFSQRSMPQAGMDPTQQKMMNLMGPIMLGVISWSVAAGLCIYWAISNLLGYLQQLFINRTELGQQVRKGIQRRTTRKR